jgi:hypothetical protein
MSSALRSPRPRRPMSVVIGGCAAVMTAALGLLALALLTAPLPAAPATCPAVAPAAATVPVLTAAPGEGTLVGATEYGGPGDPGSGAVGSSGASLLDKPRQLRGARRSDASRPPTALGGLPYMNPAADHLPMGAPRSPTSSDVGLGGAPDRTAMPRVIDLWWRLARRAPHPLRARAAGPARCQIERLPVAGAGECLLVAPVRRAPAPTASRGDDAQASGQESAHRRRRRCSRWRPARAPRCSPAGSRRRPRVRARGRQPSIIAAGNQIVRRAVRQYGAGHGTAARSVIGAGLRLLQQRLASALRRAAAARHLRRADKRRCGLRILGASPGPAAG